MPEFKVESDFQPTGDQPEAIEELVEGLDGGTARRRCSASPAPARRSRWPTSSSGAAPDAGARAEPDPGRPALLRVQGVLPGERRRVLRLVLRLLPARGVHPRTDTYIAKDADINEEIDKLRHAATRALFSRRDVMIVASVSCIYGLGEPEEYQSFVLHFEKGETIRRDRVMRRLVDMQYERNDINLVRGKFRLRGDTHRRSIRRTRSWRSASTSSAMRSSGSSRSTR